MPNTQCWEWPYAVNKAGYGQLQRNNKTLQAHRFIYEQLVGPVPASCELDHLCKNRRCVSPLHLEPVSHKENCVRGNQTKLSASDVKEIRRLHGKMSQREIAAQFGVSRASIGLIHQGKRWVESGLMPESLPAHKEEHSVNCAINAADVADEFHALGCTCKKGEDA